MEPDFFILDEDLTADELYDVVSEKLDYLFDTVRVDWMRGRDIGHLYSSALQHPNLSETLFARAFDWYFYTHYKSYDFLLYLVNSPFLTKDQAEALIERRHESHRHLHFRKDLSVKAWETMIREAKSSINSTIRIRNDIILSAAEQPHLGGLLLEIPWRVLDGVTLSRLIRNPSCPLELLQDIWSNGDFGWEKGEVEEHPLFELPKVYQVGDPLI